MVPYFLHPQDKNEKIYVSLDICHMLMLVRNTLGEGRILYDRDGGKIQWQYLVELEEFQNQKGLRLGNKLRMAHIKWKQQKMKVNLAAQAPVSLMPLSTVHKNLKCHNFKEVRQL